jgi:hypothetical protein
MIESIINNVFSISYLSIGVVLVAILDFICYRTKTTTRLTLLEIWGFTMCWPLVMVTVIVFYFYTYDN